MSTTEYEATERTRLTRHGERASYDRELVYGILDEGLICHVGFAVDGQSYVIPMGYARMGDRLILHGSVASRLMQALADGVEACVTVTLLDGLVLARSSFSHSMNYRSVVALGRATVLTLESEKREALDALVEHLVPGRLADLRESTVQEVAATAVLEFPLGEVSAKVRSGPPKDAEGDLGLPVWAGVIPLRLTPLQPEPDPLQSPETQAPDYATSYRRPEP
jgi:nitroimidazol reductase NimA-like FMN-containing flavoprotein (pyridoxamine 5'-phosphate oxidase superfamily)